MPEDPDMSSSMIRRSRGGPGSPGRRGNPGRTAPTTPDVEPIASNTDELETLRTSGPGTQAPGVLSDASLSATGDTSWAATTAGTAAGTTGTTATSPQLQAAIDSWMAAVPQDQREEAEATLPRIV
jgi:hypothetical protein